MTVSNLHPSRQTTVSLENRESILRDPIRVELREWLARQAPSLLGAYEGAITILYEPAFPGKVHFISHVVRDIYNTLPEILDGKTKRIQPGEVYPAIVRDIAKHWPKHLSFLGQVLDNPEVVQRAGAVEISLTAYRSVTRLLDKQREIEKQDTTGERLSRALHRLQPLETDIPGRLAETFDRERKWFVNRAHLARTLSKVPTEEGLIEHFETFERALYSFVGRYFSGTRGLDAVLQEANTAVSEKPAESVVESTIALASSPQHRRYFFDRLQNAEWIDSLRERGLFRGPWRGVEVEGGGVRYPPCPEAQYLARMAKHVPDKVARIFAEIETNNASVMRQVLAATEAMPATIAAQLVPRIVEAHKEGGLWGCVLDAADLCCRLATQGEADRALLLARALFIIERSAHASDLRRLDDYSYIEGLKRVTAPLATASPNGFLGLLCQCLGVIVESKAHYADDAEYDGSYGWRPAIEEHEQNLKYDFSSMFVGCVREAFEIAVRKQGVSLNGAIQILEAYQPLIYKRLRLHLINEFADQNPGLARDVMMTRDLFHDYRYKHEYAMLLGKRFPLLTDQEKATWLGWVDAGPDMTDFDERVRDNLGREPTEDDRKARIEYWQYEKLHWIREHLEGDRRAFYDRMFEEHGVPQLADLNIRVGAGGWGYESPVTLEELQDKTLDEVLELLRNWRAEEPESIGPSVEGLAETFQQYLSTDPERFSQRADSLKGLSPPYIRAYVQAMTQALRERREIHLDPIIRLCGWVLEQPAPDEATLRSGHPRSPEPHWRLTRDTICEFVQGACRPDVSEDYRGGFWGLLVALMEHSLPDRGDDLQPDADPRSKDYATLSLNRSRSRAMHAVCAYASWVAQKLATTVDGKQVVEGGFAKMPEVRDLLERELHPDAPGGFAARAVYGRRWALLYGIDREWLATHVDQIFDLETIESDPLRAYGWAAWNSFLTSNYPHVEYYRLLRKQFSYAVDHTPHVEVDERGWQKPFDSLGEHLLILYARGDLTLQADDSLIERFLTRTVPPIRTHAMEFIGRSLWQEEGKLPDPFVQRLEGLWEWYWQRIGESDARQDPHSRTFGFWFVCGAFDARWSIEQLERFVEVVPKPEPNDQIAERLAQIANTDLPRTLRIVEHLIEGDDENWRVYSWKEHLKSILAGALQDAQVRETAEQIVDRLGRRGLVEFGELLHRR